MSEERTAKKVFKNIPAGKRPVGKPRKRWLDDVENDLKKMGVRGRRNMARNTDAWKFFQKESKVLQGSYSRRAVTIQQDGMAQNHPHNRETNFKVICR